MSIIHDVEQGSVDWLALRCGIPTASEFDQIVTKAGKPSASAKKYMGRLLAERLLGESLSMSLDSLEWVERGKLLEPEAVRMLEFTEGLKTTKIGFMTSDDGRWGASPDRLLEDGSLLEVKCPAPQTHIFYELEDFGDAYKVQCQGQMLVAGERCRRVVRWSYHPRMRPVLNVCDRDEGFIFLLRTALHKFSTEMEWHEARLDADGFYAKGRVKAPVDTAYGGPSLHDEFIEPTDDREWMSGG